MSSDKTEPVYIGMGSNLEGPLDQLKAGIRGLEAIEGFELVRVSSPYISAPVGITEQPLFVNAVAHGMFKGEPLRLLDELLGVEKRQGRERLIHWGPRTLDLDLLLFGWRIIDLPRLKVPHPEICNRAFVLVPMMEISSGMVLPVWGKTARELYEAMEPAQRAAQTMDRITWDS